MTPRRPLLALAAMLAACGADPAPAPAVSPSFKVTVAGTAYAAADASGFLMAPMACGQLGAGTQTIVEVQFSTSPGVCRVAQENAFCAEQAGAVAASLAIVHANLLGGPVQAIGPGRYDSASHGLVDADGNVQWFWAHRDLNDATCGPRAGGPKEGGLGTIVFSEVGPTRIRGSAEISFDDGSTLSGPFDVPVCAVTGAARCAALKGGCTTMACAP